MLRYLWRNKPLVCLLESKQPIMRFGSNTLPKYMKAWCLDGYDENSTLFMDDVLVPSNKRLKPTEVLVKVKTASLNPVDFLMKNGFGSVIFDKMRRWNEVEDQPIILGRDFSGVVVKKGKTVTRIKEGDQLAVKPECLSHVEAASFPYVFCTVWSALCDTAGITQNNARKKRVLIVGGSGGIGTTAIQLMKAWGAHVTSTCSEDATEILERLGTDDVIDYNNEDVAKKISDMPYRFDVILDAVGGNVDQFAKANSCRGSSYILLAPPLLPNIDESGIFLGTLRSGVDFLVPAVSKRISSNINYQWAYFKPNASALNQLNKNITKGKIVPVIDSVFDFAEISKAFEKLDNGHLRGKVVLNINSAC